MYRKIIYVFSLMFFLVFTISNLNAQVKLTAGDNAPEIKYSKWFKGTPVNAFEKGKFYVVEFWATWCPPCKESIPHLTELAHKYKGKVTFIGMDGSERPAAGGHAGPEAIKLVEDFLAEYKDKMDYNVAMDTQEKFMMNNWMSAAAQYGIPTAFIVDTDSKIAWIGHPMSMDEPLAKIVEGKFDVKAFTAEFKPEQEKAFQERSEQVKFNELARPVSEANKAKDYPKVIEECEKLVAKEPSYQSKLDAIYFNALLKTNAEKAYTLAMEAKSKDVSRAKSIAGIFAKEGLDSKFYNYSLEVVVPIFEKDPKDYASMSILASTYEAMGNKAKAIEMIDKMIEFAKERKASESQLKRMEERKAKLAGK